VINLRYHIVSITAVFLALGIGITMGSTFLGRGALDRIDQNVKDAQERVQRTNAENDELRREVDELRDREEQLTSDGVRRVFEGQLEDVPVLVVAAPGVDQESLDHLSDALEGSASTFLGTLRVSPKVQLEGGAVGDLAEVLDATTREPDDLRNLAVERLALDMRRASRLPEGEEEPPQSTLPESASESLVGALVDADFMSYEPADGDADATTLLTGHGYRYVFVTGPEPEVDDETFLLPLVRAMTDERPAQLVLASAAVDEEQAAARDEPLARYLEDEQIADRITSVDDLEVFEGIAAVVLGLSDLGVDRRGHYGEGEGRDLLPTDPG
jgi:hypothetical protein